MLVLAAVWVHRDYLVKVDMQGEPGGGNLSGPCRWTAFRLQTHLHCSETFGVTMTTMRRVVPCRRKLRATTAAPWELESEVTRVTNASSAAAGETGEGEI